MKLTAQDFFQPSVPGNIMPPQNTTIEAAKAILPQLAAHGLLGALFLACHSDNAKDFAAGVNVGPEFINPDTGDPTTAAAFVPIDKAIAYGVSEIEQCDVQIKGTRDFHNAALVAGAIATGNQHVWAELAAEW